MTTNINKNNFHDKDMLRKLMLMLVLLTIGLESNAQLYYYVSAGSELMPSTEISLLYVSGGNCYCTVMKASEISSKLFTDKSYWKSWMSQKLSEANDPYVYDASLTTTSYTVYKRKWYSTDGYWSFSRGSVIGNYYRAISRDGKTIIGWRQRKDSEEVLNKKYYEVIDPEELNKNPHDFLN